MHCKRHVPRVFAALLIVVLTTSSTRAQQSPGPNDEKQSTAPAPAPAPPRRGGGQRGPAVKSPEVRDDRRVTFRILAPKAEAVRLNGGDLPGGGPQQPRTLTKGENNVWELTV